MKLDLNDPLDMLGVLLLFGGLSVTGVCLLVPVFKSAVICAVSTLVALCGYAVFRTFMIRRRDQ